MLFPFRNSVNLIDDFRIKVILLNSPLRARGVLSSESRTTDSYLLVVSGVSTREKDNVPSTPAGGRDAVPSSLRNQMN